MDAYEQFNGILKDAAVEFSKIEKKAPIRVISHLDADGISAASILLKLLNNESRKYSVSIVQQLNRAFIEQLAKESYKFLIFTDIGSGLLNDMHELLSDRKVFVLDHHSTESYQSFEHIVFVNPHVCGIDGGKEIS